MQPFDKAEYELAKSVKVEDLLTDPYASTDEGDGIPYQAYVDAVVNDRPVNDYYILKSGETNVKALPDLLTSEDYGIAVSKQNEATQKAVNEALKKLKDNGEYDKIFEKWFGKTSK